MTNKVRPDLSADELHAMSERQPGSGAAYLEARRKELAEQEAERRAKERDADSLARFTETFVAAGGRPADANAAWRAQTTRKAAEAASRKEDAARAASRRRVFDAL